MTIEAHFKQMSIKENHSIIYDSQSASPLKIRLANMGPHFFQICSTHRAASVTNIMNALFESWKTLMKWDVSKKRLSSDGG